MKIETLKKNHLKRNIIIGVIVILIISAVILNFTRAKYRVTQSIPLVNGTINYKPYDFKMIAMYQENDSGEYESVDTVPISGYTLNTTESYCEVNNEEDSSIPMTYEDGRVYIGVNTKGTKCYLYFDEQVNAGNTILAGKTISTRSRFSSVLTTNTTGTIYRATDDDGATYYYAGNVTDNWVKWAGFYWRIIRINGDGTIRILYNGTSTETSGDTTQLENTSVFNLYNNDNMYVGFKYTNGSVHGTEINSTILTILNNWYSTNLISYENYIDINAGFCNDRMPSTSASSSNGNGGTGTTATYYDAYIRLVTNKTPTFECQNSSDLFTVSSSNKGNKSLTYPIGLITADEISYAGGVNGAATVNYDYYLYTGEFYWTMSPFNYVSMFSMDSNGRINHADMNDVSGVRPVINLKADVTISGSGTTSDPYTIS